MGRYKKERKLSDVLGEFSEQKKIKKGIDETKLRNCWQSSMGKYINKYTDAVYYARGVLYVKLNSAPLRQELSMSKEKIVSKMNEAMEREVVKSVVLR